MVEATGGNGTFSGKGVIEVPYLAMIKIAVVFDNISINTDGQMTGGTVETDYDADFATGTNAGLMSVASAVEKLNETIQKTEDIIADIFNNDDEDEENAPIFEYESSGDNSGNESLAGTDSYTGTTDESSQNQESDQNGTSDSDPIASNGNLANTGSTGGPSAEPNEPDATTESSEAVIIYNGSEYGNNDIIEVEYDKDKPHFAFSLKDYPEGASLNWQVLQGDTDFTSKYAQNETIFDNLGIEMNSSVGILDIVANYGDQKIKVTIKRKRKEFELEELYAAPVDNPKRLASSEKPLYLVKSQNKRKVDFGLDIEPKLKHGDISQSDITWYYEEINTQSNLGKNYGRKNLRLDVEPLKDDFSVTVKSGNPALTEKTVDVIWFDGTERSSSFMPPVISEVLTKNFEHIQEGVKLTKKFFPIGGLKFEVDPVTIDGTSANKEDKESRLYYLEEKESIKGGVEAILAKETFTHPALKVLSRVGVADIGLYGQFSLKFYVEGGVERKKYVNKKEYEDYEPYVEIGAAGCATVGVEANLLVAKDLVDFLVDFSGQACIQGTGNYNFKTKLMTAEFFLPPAVLSGQIKIQTKGALKFELINWSESLTVGEKTQIGEPLEYQF